MLNVFSPALAPFALVALVGCSACSGAGTDSSPEPNAPRVDTAPLLRDAGPGSCRFIDGSDRVICDDDPEGKLPRVHDCTWEWADDPCPLTGTDSSSPSKSLLRR